MSQPFRQLGPTQTLSVANNSQNADFIAGADSFLITNNGDTICFARVQPVTGAAAASAVDLPIRPATAGIIDFAPGPFAGGVRVSVFSTGTITVYVTPGTGGV
jgi:hypothetical protein